MMSNEIVGYLYERYYAKISSTDHHTSSHWKEMHEKTRASLTNGELALEGYGFGFRPKMGVIPKILSWINMLVYWLILPKRARVLSLFSVAIRTARAADHPLTYDCLRQLYTYIHFIEGRNYSQITIIGDGWGFLSALVCQLEPGAKLCVIDLGKTLIFQAKTLSSAAPHARLALMTEDGYIGDAIPETADCVLCPAEHYETLAVGPIEIVINVCSMQEMSMETINGYFRFLRQNIAAGGLLYCCNRYEKILPDGEVVRIYDYPWQGSDEVLLDEICPWSRFFLDRKTLDRGPALGGLRIPLVNYFDGDIIHRLVRMNSDAGEGAL